MRHADAQSAPRRQLLYALERLWQVKVCIVLPCVEEGINNEQLDARGAQRRDELLRLRRQLRDVRQVHHARVLRPEAKAHADIVGAVPDRQRHHRHARHRLEWPRALTDGRTHDGEVELCHAPPHGRAPRRLRVGVAEATPHAVGQCKVGKDARDCLPGVLCEPNARRRDELLLLGVILQLDRPLHQPHVIQPHDGISVLVREHHRVEPINAVLGEPAHHRLAERLAAVDLHHRAVPRVLLALLVAHKQEQAGVAPVVGALPGVPAGA
mmetsp:Transcript_10149/g.31783  ORF Transcript_10149/g.31783 Transcript_10149/m.31783 type:complete len:268 (-) Transcript_10149:128-931(-)